MTAVTRHREPVPSGATPAARRWHWQPWALAAICVLAAVLYGWDIWGGSQGNTFYTAAVKSMSESFTNFLFGSFDPAGVVTVDKPPMALWPQVVSVWIFGFHGWSVLLPQVVEGVATVFLLHRTVRLWAGENVALLAALILALTPVTVAIDFVNNPDCLLVLWLVAAAYALTRSLTADTARGRTRWLLWCAAFIGCGFVTKMLAAWIVVPAFAIAYLAGTSGPWRRRVYDLLAATGVLLVTSFWWPLLHDLWPGAKPYMDNSTNGTAFNLIFDYNGFGRIFGESGGRGGGGAFGGGAAGRVLRDLPAAVRTGLGGLLGGGSGIGRLFGPSVGGQISWLMPLALLVLALIAARGVLRLRRHYPARPLDRAMWVMWGGWLVVMGLVFSYAQGIWHSYYTTALAPAIAALAAAGLAVLWRQYRKPAGYHWTLLPIAVLGTAAWAYVAVSRDSGWYGWAAPAVAVLGVLAALVLVLNRLPGAGGFGRAGLVLALVAVVFAPAVWSAGTAFASTRAGGALAQAGPSGGFGGGRGFGGRGFGGRNAGGRGAGFAAAATGTLSTQDQRILDYVTKADPGARIKLAIEGGATQAAPWIIGSDQTVIGMGGFFGTDNAPSIAQLSGWVADGQLRFVLGSATGGRGFGGFGGGRGAGGAAGARDQWVTQHCTAVNPSAYGGGGFGAANTLYQCTG